MLMVEQHQAQDCSTQEPQDDPIKAPIEDRDSPVVIVR